jgi:hypothetical protein
MENIDRLMGITIAKVKKAAQLMFMIIDDGTLLQHIAPGVAIFEAYDLVTRRMCRYRAVDKGDIISIERY